MVGMLYEGSFGTPGLRDLLENVENQFWVGRYELQEWSGEVIDGASVDSGNTNHTGDLRAGLLMGKVTATGKVKQWDPTASDGTQNIYGILGHMQTVSYQGSTLDRLTAIMVAGRVDPTKLLVPGSSTLGIAANANRIVIKNMLSQRFLLPRDYVSVDVGGWRNITAKTADYTVTEADHGILFTTRGATGTVIFTLPATPLKGLRFGFYNAAGQTMTVTAGTADTLTVFNDLTADSITFQTASELIGGHFEVVGDGTGWLVINHLGAEAQTITVAT